MKVFAQQIGSNRSSEKKYIVFKIFYSNRVNYKSLSTDPKNLCLTTDAMHSNILK